MQRIGIALSGGGYRAAGWGLGVILYLADAGLNRSVETVSSVSGGSISNAALGLEPYRKMEPADAWRFAAGIAPKLAGRFGGFLGVLALHVVAWGTAISLAALHELAPAALGLGLAVAASLLLARACGDATFGSSIAWLYCDVLMASLCVLAWVVGQGWWWLAALPLVGVVLLFRGLAVGWSIGRSLLLIKGQRATLGGVSDQIDHVLCACDLHGRHHVYFGRDFVYSYGLGLGSRPSLPLDAAVQSSANLPGAFPPRLMRASPFRFAGARYRSPMLALTDGGVYDNMAEEWLLSFPERTARFKERAADVARTDPHLGALLGEAAERLSKRAPNFHVVANASGSLGFRFAWTTFLPLVGELLSLLRVKSILYDDGHTMRRRFLVDQFIDGDASGILVHISTDPWKIIADGRASADRAVSERAEVAAERLRTTPGLDEASTEQPAGAGTTLYPVGKGRIAKLLQRSYALACIQGYIWYDLPLVAIPPLGWFEALEAGRVGDRPMPPPSAIQGVDELESASPGETVPMWVDAIRDIEGTSMIRLTFFVVSSQVPEPSWLLELSQRHGASVVALGMVGVICGPGPRTALFRAPHQLGGLFEEITEAPNLAIDVEDLSLPASWFGTSVPSRGDVFRVDRFLFQTAYRFRSGDLELSELAVLGIREGAVVFSPEETVAFREWAQGRIDEAVSIYPKDEELRLTSREAT